MTFFNKKEEVIKIELTPYGRSLLSKGELLPAYYSFFDDDILYDLESAAGQNAAGSYTKESQNLIQKRILQETPRLRPQRCHESPEKIIHTNEQSQEHSRPHTKQKLNYFTEPMGTSDQKSNLGPAWKSLFILGEVSGSDSTGPRISSVLTGSARKGQATVILPGPSATSTNNIGSSQYLKQIPQINSIVEYTMMVDNINNYPRVRGRSPSPNNPVTPTRMDGTFIRVLEEQIICELTEKEGFLFKDGLEVSAYLYDDSSEETLIPLNFLPTTSMIKNGMLMEAEVPPDLEVDPTYVEYYVNFTVDSNIPKDQICKGVNQLKASNVQIGIEIECDDVVGVDFDIYGTRVTEIEECD